MIRLVIKVDGEWMKKGILLNKDSPLSRTIQLINSFMKVKNANLRLLGKIFLCSNMTLVWSFIFICNAKPLKIPKFYFLLLKDLIYASKSKWAERTETNTWVTEQCLTCSSLWRTHFHLSTPCIENYLMQYLNKIVIYRITIL